MDALALAGTMDAPAHERASSPVVSGVLRLEVRCASMRESAFFAVVKMMSASSRSLAVDRISCGAEPCALVHAHIERRRRC